MRWLVVLVLLGGTAHAQAPTETAPRYSASDEPPGLKDPRTAMVLSSAGAILPFIAILAIPDDPHSNVDDVFGLSAAALFVLAPSAGHWYAGEGVTTGLAIRLTGAAIFTGLLLGDPDERSKASPLLFGGAMLSFTTVAVGAAWDLATVNRAVARHNERQYRLQLAPMVTSRGGTGLSVTGSF